MRKALQTPIASNVTVAGCKSWRFESGPAVVSITKHGGHLLPERFHLGRGKTVSPYFVAPWGTDRPSFKECPALRPLRGNFFCLPFAWSSKKLCGVDHLPHGEASYAPWSLDSTAVEGSVFDIQLSLRYKLSSLVLNSGVQVDFQNNVLKTRHQISKLTKPITYGFHPMLVLPKRPEVAFLSKSRYLFGQIYPDASDPGAGEYSALKVGATFDSLKRVPLANGGMVDLTCLPQNEGFTDILTLASDPSYPVAWTTLVYPQRGYLWFSLKNTRTLPTSVIWLQNGGRHGKPWNGIKGVVGLEETLGLPEGLARSIQSNVFSKNKVQTASKATDREITTEMIEGICRIPRDFSKVIEIEFKRGQIAFVDSAGKKVRLKSSLLNELPE